MSPTPFLKELHAGGRNFELRPLGRMAIFYVPSVKWQDVAVQIHEFLAYNFQGYTVSDNVQGFWQSESKRTFREPVREVKVSFIGKERIADLADFLVDIAEQMEEECVYLETGEDSWLVYPK